MSQNNWIEELSGNINAMRGNNSFQRDVAIGNLQVMAKEAELWRKLEAQRGWLVRDAAGLYSIDAGQGATSKNARKKIKEAFQAEVQWRDSQPHGLRPDSPSFVEGCACAACTGSRATQLGTPPAQPEANAEVSPHATYTPEYIEW